MNHHSASHRDVVAPLLTALATAVLATCLDAQRAVPIPAPPPARANCAAAQDVLDAAVRDVHERQRNVGLSAAILLRGRVVASWSLGMADLESHRPVTSGTRFGIASITKAFTGIALLQAHQRGQIDLDAPIQRYVPGFPVKPGVPITLRLLAAHMGGIRHWGPERGPALYARHFDDVNDILPLFAGDPLAVPAGSKYSYSSYGYNLIAAALESATGVQFQRLVSTGILEPLRLRDTGFDDVRRADPRTARRYSFYDVDSGAELAAPVRVPAWDYSHNIAGGNMSSTAEDLVRFGRALIAPGLLTPGSIELLSTRPRIGGVESPMSFGWFVAPRGQKPREWHMTGSNAGLQAALYVFPDDDLAVAVLSNTWGVGSRSGEMADLPLRLGRLCLGDGAPPHVDRIFVNGRIWTGDETRPSAEALAVSGDKLVAVGTTVEVRALAAADSSVVDLHGRRVVPGFNDAHLHFPGPSIDVVDLAGAESLAELQRRIADFAKAHPASLWVVGRGWGYSAFPDGRPDKTQLDAVVSDRPAYITERDGHMGLANSRALSVAGITRATPDPPNGRLVRGANGEPTGELQEAAQDLVDSHIPPASFDETYAAFRRHIDEAASYGLTSVQNASWSPRDQRLVERARADGALTLRFRFAVPILPNDGGAPEGHALKTPLTSADIATYRELRDTFKGPLITHGAIKGFVDGTVDARTAAMFEPYVGGGTGIPFWDQADLNATVALYDREGFQVLLHAVGDRAIHMALDAFEYAAKTNGTSGRRHRIEHVEVPALADLPRFKQLGVIAVTQPMFANPDATTLDNFAVLLGPARASHADAFRIFDDAGAVQAFGSDWPVFTNEPLSAIYCAVTRMTPTGTPAGGWYPEGRVTVETALRHYTRDAAYASFDEAIKGTLSPGKLADFVVLSDDILTIPPTQILKTKALLTVMGGRDTYRSADFR